jgi:hypothetical protein
MSRHFAISWKINTYWTVEYDLHDDDTVTILAHYQDGRDDAPGCMHSANGELSLRTCMRYRIQETDLEAEEFSRHAVALEIYDTSESIGAPRWQRGAFTSKHKIRNDAYVFSYPQEPLFKVDVEAV